VKKVTPEDYIEWFRTYFDRGDDLSVVEYINGLVSTQAGRDQLTKSLCASVSTVGSRSVELIQSKMEDTRWLIHNCEDFMSLLPKDERFTDTTTALRSAFCDLVSKYNRASPYYGPRPTRFERILTDG